jgi:hypothetical protein
LIWFLRSSNQLLDKSISPVLRGMSSDVVEQFLLQVGKQV